MHKKKPAWPADADLAKRFSHPANTSIVALLTNGYPWSAHSDPAEEFYFGRKDLPGVEAYCPDSEHFAYEFAYTDNGIIFGVVLGMRDIYVRLPKSGEWARTLGGAPFPEIGPDWYAFEVKYDRGVSSSRWLRRAYDEARETAAL